MRKQLIVSTCILLATYVSGRAQNIENPTFAAGTHLLSVGYGVPNVAGRNLYYFQNDKFTSVGPIYGRYEYGITDVVSIGAQASFSQFSYTYNDATGMAHIDKGSAYDFQLYGSYHFGKLLPVENLDFYAYAGLGMWYIDLTSVQRPSRRLNEGVFHLSLKGGARYYFAPFIAGYAQLGFDKMSVMDFGLSFNFTPNR